MRASIKIFILALFFSYTNDSQAQTFGIKAGYNLANMQLKKSQNPLSYDYSEFSTYGMIPGFHVGASAEFSIVKYVSLETGLLFTSRGTIITNKDTFWSTPIITTEKNKLYYLNIPLSVKIPVTAGDFTFFGSFGSYFGLGLTGKINTDLTYGELAESEVADIKWGYDENNDNFSQIDYGLTFGTGVRWRSVQIGLTYDLGLADISPDPGLGNPLNNSVLGVSAGYLFGGRKKSEPAKPLTEKPKEERIPKKESISKESASQISEKKSMEDEIIRARKEKSMNDSINAIRLKEEQNRLLKIRQDSIINAKALADKIEAEKQRTAKVKTDSIAASQGGVLYRVQFISNTSKKGSYKITIGDKDFITWEYLYSGAYRSTVGEFKTFRSALEFQKIVRQSGYPQAFVVAFKNNIRTTDPALFK